MALVQHSVVNFKGYFRITPFSTKSTLVHEFYEPKPL